jgi:integrase
VWATALYAGLRRGELQALRWRDVDLEAGVIRVEGSWDDKGADPETLGERTTRQLCQRRAPRSTNQY